MKIPDKTRHWILGLTLVATLIAVVYPVEQDPAPTRAVGAAPPKRKAIVESPGDIPSISITRPTIVKPASDPLSATAWLPPPPPPPKPVPPPPPTAPLFPYTYLGRVDDAGKGSVLIGRNNDNKAVQAGDTVDGVWRVERIGDNAMELVYVPLDQKQTLSIGSTP